MTMLAQQPILDGDDVFARVRSLRQERGETGAQFGGIIGLSKSKVSELEGGKYIPSVETALAIERLSGGRIDAAELSADVRAARHGLNNAATQQPSSTGQIDEASTETAEARS